jgi:hypothetical protein
MSATKIFVRLQHFSNIILGNKDEFEAIAERTDRYAMSIHGNLEQYIEASLSKSTYIAADQLVKNCLYIICRTQENLKKSGWMLTQPQMREVIQQINGALDETWPTYIKAFNDGISCLIISNMFDDLTESDLRDYGNALTNEICMSEVINILKLGIVNASRITTELTWYEKMVEPIKIIETKSSRYFALALCVA